MLTVYSTYGSPGASTTAVYLAAQWASTGRQVLLIETDAAAGSLSQKLGIQFTPGTASFTAAGKPATAANLIEHAQDVLFNDFHVMPTPSSPSGAKTVAEKFARLGEELRDISDSEMAIIVDGGRLTAEARTSELTTSAAAVLVVTRDNTQLPSLEHVSGALVDDPTLPGPLGLVATVGPSPLKDAEWNSNHGLKLVGSVDLSSERGTDLSMFMSRGKRKSRKLRGSLEKLADTLYEYACQASAAAPRARPPANRPAVDEDVADAPEADSAAAPAPQSDLMVEPPPPMAPAASPPLAPAAAPAMPPPQAPAYEQPYDPQGYPAPEHAPPGHAPAPYGQPPPMPQGYEQPAYPQPDYPPPDYQQHGYAQPPYSQQGYAESGYAPPAHGQPGQAPPPQQPMQPPPPTSAYEQPMYGHGSEAAPPYGQPPISHQPVPPAIDPSAMPPAETPTVPTGSFRSWAVQLFGESAGGDPDDNRSDPGAGATA